MGKRIQTREQRQRQVIARLINENRMLREKVKVQEARIIELGNLVEKLQLQIEELHRIIFGGSKKERSPEQESKGSNISTTSYTKRPPESYRRSVPALEEITSFERSVLHQCSHCNGEVSHIQEVEQYVEDMLPLCEWYKKLKTVTQEVIETGYCKRCRKRVSAKLISQQQVRVGRNIKQFVAFGTIIMRLSYEQVKNFLEGTTKIKLSDGEISNILQEEAGRLKPAFERLKEKIRGQPAAHFDETSWNVQQSSHGNFAWAMTTTDTTDTVFMLGRSRGKGNVVELKGKNSAYQTGISDDYGAYKNIFVQHALCWAHPYRKLRDLKNSEHISPEKKVHCTEVYERFAHMYDKVRTVISEPYDKKKRFEIKERLMKTFEEIIQEDTDDPAPLQRIKKRLREQKECYFVCIEEKGIPADNNKAERALRHLVLKRKNSYGSKTQAGADWMSVLYSVLLSWWWESKDTFFEKLAERAESVSSPIN